jgi:hypothetical protein
MCAHLIRRDENTQPQRTKEQAAPVRALYVDGDGAQVPDSLPPPTAVVRSSPSRDQFWWQLTHSIEPERAEALNKRLAYAMGADRSGWDLTQLLRPPGTPNRKYPDAPPVQLAMIDDALAYDPDELERILPEAPARSTVSIVANSDDPPVRLDADAMEWWTGKRKTANRSDTLWAVARDLARAGAMPHTIAAAIQNRDETFYPEDPKYGDRPEMYLQTAIRATEKVMAEEKPATDPDVGIGGDAETIQSAPDCADRVQALEAKVERLQTTLRSEREARKRGEETWSRSWAVIRNKHLRPGEKVGILATLFIVESTAQDSSRVDDAGRVITCRAAIADVGGVGVNTITRAVDRAAEWGLIQKDVVPVWKDVTDTDTGEIQTRKQTEWRLRLNAEPRAIMETLATFEPPDTTPRQGGKRERKVCPAHPHAATHWIGYCEVCANENDEKWEYPLGTVTDQPLEVDPTIQVEQLNPDADSVDSVPRATRLNSCPAPATDSPGSNGQTRPAIHPEYLPSQCHACKRTMFKRTADKRWLCATCHPPGPAETVVDTRAYAAN